ncbi:NAC domain containing protein 50 isoform X2 [Daucus carota subsp. sativus]|uniref:NAC domain containing protein 50 isoform X2 n=1 Tax=Daucus carota subsp. sativus TaxID=79200 RepID=UPI0007EF4D07|nr:PREDICTED: NAC domain-containing protein 78 isoform X1 [Daucus carota subsp. sativus]
MDPELSIAPAVHTPTVVPASQPKCLAPGFRFHPTDEELVRYYLTRKACGKPFRFQAVSEIDVYKSEPWELAGYSSLSSRDLEWYFFSPVDRKYGNGSRLNRATGKGYWKATGKDRSVRHKGQTIGMKKTLVFHSGRAPDGKRTNWVMHEYRLSDIELQKSGVAQDAFVLCRIFEKSGLGPPNGDRYAPFIEEEWEDDAALLVPGGEAEEELANGDDVRIGASDFEKFIQDANKASHSPSEIPMESLSIPFGCKRERTDDCPINGEAELEPVQMFEIKRSKHSNPSSEDSTTTSHDLPAGPSTNGTLLEFPLLDSIGNRESHQSSITLTFDASNLEKSVPPGYLKFISNLENEILNVSMERETLKIEVMRAQAMINVLQSRIEYLNKDNEEYRRMIQGK